MQAFGLNQITALSLSRSQQLSAKKLYAAQRKLKGAACLVGSYGGGNTEKLEHLFGLPVVLSDPLARNSGLVSYTDFLVQLTNSFYQCLNR